MSSYPAQTDFCYGCTHYKGDGKHHKGLPLTWRYAKGQCNRWQERGAMWPRVMPLFWCELFQRDHKEIAKKAVSASRQVR